MTNKDELICATYMLTALVARPATGINNIAFMTQSGDASFTNFFHSAYVNAAASLSNDLILLAFAACIFIEPI